MKTQRLFIGVLVLCILLILTATAGLAQGPTPTTGGNPNPPGGGKPITSVKAGAGLIGGGTSGEVTLAISTTFQLPQACANGQVAKWNGTTWVCANDGLTLPFAGSANSSSDLISVTNTGSGRAGYFKIDNTASNSNALRVETNGFYPALGVYQTGMGHAGRFVIYKGPDNTMTAVDGMTDGSGTAVMGTNTGTGVGGSFRISNTLNSNTALHARTIGTGSAGRFESTNPVNTSSALRVIMNGTGSAAEITTNNTASTLPAIRVTSYTNGKAGFFQVDNPTSINAGLEVTSNGIGPTFVSRGTGVAGYAARIEITNTANYSSALRVINQGQGDAVHAYTTGSRSAGYFSINNPANGYPALSASTDGTGWAGNFSATGSGKGIYISVPSGNEGLNIASGTKNAVVATSNGARLMYTEESSQVWFTDYGFGRLQNGRARITLDSLFAETVNLDEAYHVFVQAYGDAEIFVTNRTRTGFEVKLRAGEPDVEFSYRLVAKRKGFEDKRLERAPWADNDPNLFPQK